ncbi:MAG: branched-chain amino acid ABC transporter permease [Nitrososphaerota archaeon]
MTSLFLFTLIVGLIIGLYYAMMALGLNLVFGVVKIANLAHGDFIMLSAYMAFWLYALFGVSPLLSLVFVVPVFFLVGMLVYFAMVRQLIRRKDSEMTSIVAFFGLSIVIESSSSLAFGNSYRTLPLNFLPVTHIYLLGFSLPLITVLVAAVSILVLFLLFYYLDKTRYGLSVKAMMSDEENARAYGLNIQMIYATAIGLGIAITAVAGIFSPYILGAIYPSEGGLITIIAFSVIIIGALGNLAATIVGGLVYGVVINIMNIYAPGWSYAATFIILVVIILIRPNGLVGARIREI